MKAPVNGWLTGTLASAQLLTPSARSLILDVPGWPGNQAGQHVDIRLTAPDGYQAVRSYSMASAGSGTQIELAIDRLPNGEVSPFLVDELELGDEIELRGPLGGWFVWRPEQNQPVQLIAGGSGVVPFISMLRAHSAAGSPASMQLLYSLSTPEDAFFRHELSQPSTNPLTSWHYTRAAPPGWPTPPRRLTAEDLEEKVLPPEQEPLTYICGPTGFVETVSRTLISLGHAANYIRTERFGGS